MSYRPTPHAKRIILAVYGTIVPGAVQSEEHFKTLFAILLNRLKVPPSEFDGFIRRVSVADLRHWAEGRHLPSGRRRANILAGVAKMLQQLDTEA